MWKLKLASKVMGGPKNPLDNKEFRIAQYVRYGGFFVAGGAIATSFFPCLTNMQHSLCWVSLAFLLLLFGLVSIQLQPDCRL